MELSRRDALAALGAIGIGGGAAYYALEGGDRPDGAGMDGPGTDRAETDRPETLLDTAAALAAVVYPSEVEASAEFARTYVSGRVGDDDAYREAMTAAAAVLDERAEDAHGAPFRDLSAEEGDAVLREMGMRGVDPDPDGTERERVRFYLVNELLYGLLSSPKGGELVGIESPPGYPGGLEAYQEAPQR
ncbi:MAG: gluconate 2-dehydrogenase subunit 3 family protein [Halosimplex sp.]